MEDLCPTVPATDADAGASARFAHTVAGILKLAEKLSPATAD